MYQGRQRKARRELVDKRRGIEPNGAHALFAEEDASSLLSLATTFRGKCRRCRARGHKSAACPRRNAMMISSEEEKKRDGGGGGASGAKAKAARKKRKKKRRRKSSQEKPKPAETKPKPKSKPKPRPVAARAIGASSKAQKRAARKARADLLVSLTSMEL